MKANYFYELLDRIEAFDNKLFRSNDDQKLAFAAFFPTTVLTVQLLLLYGMGLLPFHSVTRVIAIVLSGLAVLRAIPVILRRSFIPFAILYASAAGLVFLSIIVFPHTIKGIKTIAFDLFFRCIPAFLCVWAMNKRSELLKESKKHSIIIFTASTLYAAFAFWAARDQQLKYSMTFSYNLLLPACTFIVYYFKSSRPRYIALSISSVILILVLGSGGAVVSFFVLFAALIIQNIRQKPKSTFIAVFVVVTLFLCSEYILDFIKIALNGKEYYSRSISHISSGTFLTHSSGRNVLYAKSLQAILERPYLGYGLAGDRAALGIIYPHNLFLEIMLHFGIIIGGAICIALVFTFVVGYFKDSNKDLFVLLFTIGFIPLIVSGTYLSSPNLWMAVAYSLSAIIGKRQDKGLVESQIESKC